MINIESQNNLSSEILKKLVELEHSRGNYIYVINLVGEKGSGKSAIIDRVVSDIPIGWNVNKIVGTENDTLPNASVEVGTITEFYVLPSISLKYDIATCGISLRFQEADKIFNDIQKKFINNVIRNNNPRLIIVENFFNLDDLSRKFVKTLWSEDLYNYNFKKRFSRVAKGPIVFLITSDTPLNTAALTFNIMKINEVETKNLSKEAYDFDLSDEQARQIVNITGGNIKFINCILKTYGHIPEQSLDKIIEKRIEDISKTCRISDTDTIEKICTYGAYFEQGFTVDYLVKIVNDLTEEKIYEIFSKLQEFGFIEGDTEYKCYTVEKLRDAFINKKINLRLLYFRSMYKFYSTYYDFQYATRLKFLYNAYLQEKHADYYNKLVALIFVDICAKIYNRSINRIDEVNEYLNNYSQIAIPTELLNILFDMTTNSLKYEQIQRLLSHTYDTLILAELHRIVLNLISSAEFTTRQTNSLIEQAIKIRMQLENHKFMGQTHNEKYECLVLQEAIVAQLINRSTLFNTFKAQKECYEHYIKLFKDIDSDIYNEFLNRYKRKSCLYENCDFSLQYLEDAQDYFEVKKNIYELQKTYTNQLGLYCVMSRTSTDKCVKLSKLLKEFMNKEKDVKFTDDYKYEHNLYLYEFMRQASFCDTDNKYKRIAKETCVKYDKLYRNNNKNLLRLNIVSLTCIFNTKRAMKLTEEFLKDLANAQNFDKFYTYHLYNYKIMFCIMEHDWTTAQRILENLRSMDFPIFNDAEENYQERLNALEIIIHNEIECNGILEYDRLIFDILSKGTDSLKYFFGQDESWKFYSKSFLLTDAQYFD